MFKWYLLGLLIAYILVFFNPRFNVKVHGRPSDSIWLRAVGALMLTVAIGIVIGLPILGVVALFLR